MRDEHVNIHRKYLIFLAIPINLLLWGWKIWALHKTLLGSLKVFLTWSIRSIMGITMEQVRDRRITNESVCDHFYHTPTTQNQIAIRQLSFVGNIFHRKYTHLLTKLLTSQCTHKWRRGGNLAMNKKLIVRNLLIILPTTDKVGYLSTWSFHTLDKGHWRELIDTLRHPGNTPTHRPPPRTCREHTTEWARVG